ncbi:odorant receptor 94a-like [Rhagoletis pomonella]|uniref:odorant receptor 94a-like n=1 Tax=Rhagoletis pomonella TaxID=28610 RepID=UPI001785FA20|nr:odorant receptor 94a-like [Rhagoletis pomonella]
MEFDNINGARRIIKILQLMGLWRSSGPRQRLYAAYSYLLHFTFTFPYTVMMWLDVAQANDLQKFTYIMYMSLTELALLAKVINVWLNARLFVNFFYTLANDVLFRLRTHEERQFGARVHKYYRWIAFMYFFMSITLVTIAFVGVLFAAEYELPFPYAPPFDWQNERGYWYAYFYELVAMPVTCFSNCALDMIQCYMLLHLSLCYKMIAGRLEEMGKQRQQLRRWSEFSEMRLLEEFVGIAKLHDKTKKLSESCEIFVSFPFLIQIMCSSFVLCFSAYRLQKVSIFENPSQFCTLILAVIVMTLQIFIPCYCGNEIILNSGALNDAVYHAEWVQCMPKMRKYLIIYMEMLQKPIKVKAGNFFEIGLPVFVKTMNNTYSLMALLLNMNK